MAWQSGSISPTNTSPALDISKIKNDLNVLKTVLGGGTDADVPNAAATAAANAQTTANSAVTAAGNAQTTANSAVTAAGNAQTTANAALPKAGGTVTGPLVLNNTVYVYGKSTGGVDSRLIGVSGDNFVDIINGTGTKVRVVNQAYNAELVTVDNSGNTIIAGNLTVQGKNAVRSVNGAAADASGNVTINVSGFVPTDSNGAVGTFGFFEIDTAYNTTCNPGSTVPGSILLFAGVSVQSGRLSLAASGGAPFGTWRALGYAVSQGQNNQYAATVFQRIA